MARPETGLVSIFQAPPPEGGVVTKLLTEIQPSPENEKLYRPVATDDPDIQALADSIRRYGLQEPIVVSLDHYIHSGHRRYVACGLAEFFWVPCRVVDVRRGDPEFLTLLREFNRQRVKSRDEVTREEVVSADPEEAYRRLVEHRRQQAQGSADAFAIEGTMHRARISDAKQPFLEAVPKVIRGRRLYWPLTDRQIHYALLNDPPLRHAKKPGSVYRNDRKSYKDICDLITRARLAGVIPFRAIADPTRPVKTWDIHQDVGPFVRRELKVFLKGFSRDLQQSQPNHLEILGEKNTIDNIIRPVARQYCIPLTLGRGYCSLSPRGDLAQRFQESGKEQLVLLVLSDFDPEGEDIAHSFARSMRDDFGIDNITPIKVALTKDQVVEMGLPPVMKAKQTSSRCAKFTERHGDDVFELEAVPPPRPAPAASARCSGPGVRRGRLQQRDRGREGGRRLPGRAAAAGVRPAGGKRLGAAGRKLTGAAEVFSRAGAAEPGPAAGGG
jgi:hypothetical protein